MSFSFHPNQYNNTGSNSTMQWPLSQEEFQKQQRKTSSVELPAKLYLPREEIRRVKINSGFNLDDINNLIKKYVGNDEQYTSAWLDSEKEWVRFDTEEEFEEAIQHGTENKLLKVKVESKKPIVKPTRTEAKEAREKKKEEKKEKKDVPKETKPKEQEPVVIKPPVVVSPPVVIPPPTTTVPKPLNPVTPSNPINPTNPINPIHPTFPPVNNPVNPTNPFFPQPMMMAPQQQNQNNTYPQLQPFGMQQPTMMPRTFGMQPTTNMPPMTSSVTMTNPHPLNNSGLNNSGMIPNQTMNNSGMMMQHGNNTLSPVPFGGNNTGNTNTSNNPSPYNSMNNSMNVANTNPTTTNTSNLETKYKAELDNLVLMGFSDKQTLLRLLEENKGNVNTVVEKLFNNQTN
ncbi:hypothetical protein ABK040_001560 [Willaertia magna]